MIHFLMYFNDDPILKLTMVDKELSIDGNTYPLRIESLELQLIDNRILLDPLYSNGKFIPYDFGSTYEHFLIGRGKYTFSIHSPNVKERVQMYIEDKQVMFNSNLNPGIISQTLDISDLPRRISVHMGILVFGNKNSIFYLGN